MDEEMLIDYGLLSDISGKIKCIGENGCSTFGTNRTDSKYSYRSGEEI